MFTKPMLFNPEGRRLYYCATVDLNSGAGMHGGTHYPCNGWTFYVPFFEIVQGDGSGEGYTDHEPSRAGLRLWDYAD